MLVLHTLLQMLMAAACGQLEDLVLCCTALWVQQPTTAETACWPEDDMHGAHCHAVSADAGRHLACNQLTVQHQL